MPQNGALVRIVGFPLLASLIKEENLFSPDQESTYLPAGVLQKGRALPPPTLLRMILSSGSRISTCIPISGLEGANPFVLSAEKIK
jgi:hypothetical protein